MLADKKIENHKYYFKDQLQDDYYNKDDPKNLEGIGHWYGKGAEALGKSGDVDKSEFWQILRGYNPNSNEKLSPFVRKEVKRMGHDYVFNSNKDFSIIYNIADDGSKLKEELDKAWKETNEFVRSELQSHLTIRDGDKYVKCDGAVIFYFEHETARAQDGKTDMHKHNHNVIANYALGSDGKWKAVDHKILKEAKKSIDIKAHAMLSKRLRELGFKTIEHDRQHFHIQGISEEARQYFSGRKNKINEKVGIDGTYAQRQNAANQKQKKANYELSELKSEWKNKLNEFGLNKDGLELMQKYGVQEKKIITKDYVLRKAHQLAKSKNFKKEHVEQAITKLSQSGEIDRDKMMDEIFNKYRGNRAVEVSSNKPEHKKTFYDPQNAGKQNTDFQKDVKSLNQAIDREKVKSGVVPDKNDVKKQHEKMFPKPQKQPQKPSLNKETAQPKSLNSGARNAKFTSSSLGVVSAGHDIQQQINSLANNVNEIKLSLGKLNQSDPQYMEKLAQLYAIQVQIGRLVEQKGRAEQKEFEEKMLKEKQQEMERTR